MKFRSVTMAFWIKNSCCIPFIDLEQLMSDVTENLLHTFMVIDKVFGYVESNIYK